MHKESPSSIAIPLLSNFSAQSGVDSILLAALLENHFFNNHQFNNFIIKMAKPVQIVKLDKKNDGIDLDIEALANICLNEKCRDRPICVVSIAGDYRKGKSFMLNFFLRYLYYVSEKQKSDEPIERDWLGKADEELRGFTWRGGQNPETTGILIWDDPIVIRRKGGEEVAVLLMDTQGAFDMRQTKCQTAIIFALSTLVSSLQIYNVMNNIQEDNLETLTGFSAYGQLVREKSDHKPFQDLCFLVRDWRFADEDAFGFEGGASLLNQRLDSHRDRPNDARDKIRERLDDCYEKISCYLMPYPGEKVSADKGFTGKISEMNPIFVEHLENFVSSTLNPDKLVIKSVCDEPVNGKSLLEYFKVYAEVFIGEKLPEPKAMFEATAEASHQAAVANSKAHYMSSMKEICGGTKPYVNPKVLEQKHSQLLQESLAIFDKSRKYGPEYTKTYLDNLRKDLLSSYDEFAEANSAKSLLNTWASPLILLCFWFLAFTLSRLFEILGAGLLANLFYLQSTICFIAIIAYLSLKMTGNFPEVVVAIDGVAEFCWTRAMDVAISQIATQRVQQ